MSYYEGKAVFLFFKANTNSPIHMSIHALIRYSTIDRCLRDPSRTYNLESLREACAQAVEDHTGTYKKPSIRTLRYDISHMRSGALGYIAPIEFSQEKGYYYTNPNFSIHNFKFNKSIVPQLKDALLLLHQFTQENQLSHLQQAVLNLREALCLNKEENYQPKLYLETSTNAPGQRWLNDIYMSISRSKAITLHYFPFVEEPLYITISPYFIKEYNNRWYVIGYDHNNTRVVNLSLDRINSIRDSIRPFDATHKPAHDEMYAHIYGVTIPEDNTPVLITFETTKIQAKYLDTKPIHPSQKKLEEREKGRIRYTIEVCVNYEIIHRFMAAGTGLEVLSPQPVRDEMLRIVSTLYKKYTKEQAGL